MVVVGCGGDVSEDDARSGWAKTNAVLSSGGMAAQSSAGDTAQDPSYRALPVGTSVDYQYACSGGGTLHFVGTYEVATGLGTDVNFTYDATFAGCDAGGVTVDGQLDYAASVSTSDTGTSITYDYKGDLTWSGDVEGGCVIGEGSLLTSHAMTKDRFILREIHIGAEATVGAGSILMPGVRVGAGSILLPGSIVRAGTVVPPGQVWGGVPAVRIK